ncbi:polyphosphate polymerase domain-containing protein [Armatimonas sp.]|uniref:polyphosphate polymerase domain-containing protein n=1 Tax=Armatimonas sp. TaxID=1872638 RepID=UPI00286BDFD2|nr:polyphosphate polymerase domain-containing protein [Armatimonas sp.]
MSIEGEIVRAGFERKYLVPESLAESLLSAVQAILPPDPYGGRYSVASLYLDTPDLASYRREVQGKWRLRRYSTTETVFAEFKAKPEPGKVHKRRSALSSDQLPASLPGWFQKAIHKQSLSPTRLVTYTRDAFVGELGGEEVRLTLDHAVQASSHQSLHFPPFDGGQGVGFPLTEGRILEIKYEFALPAELAKLTSELGLLPESFSKYRTAIEKIPPSDGG